MAGEQNEILVDARWLGEHRAAPDVVLVDTRAAADFRAGHLAGARHFDPFPFHHSWIPASAGCTSFARSSNGSSRRSA